MADGDQLVLGNAHNSEQNRTSITKTQGFYPVLDLDNEFGVGLLITSGESEYHEGIHSLGEGLASFSPGWAVNAKGDVGGVIARGSKRGVEAFSDAGIGVYSRSKTDTGIYGSGLCGVAGSASEEQGIGVRGESTGYMGVGVRALAGEMGSGVHASAIGEGGKAIYAFGGKGAIAGFFQGGLLVQGDFLVTGIKSAAVPHPDGSYRTLYAVESPECWFEDFGRAALERGEASVELQPDFSAVIDSEDMHVFLTAEGNSNGLYVDSQSAKAFTVREAQDGASNVSFSYRVVARRKDNRGERMKEVRWPEAPLTREPEPGSEKPEPHEAKDINFYKGESR